MKKIIYLLLILFIICSCDKSKCIIIDKKHYTRNKRTHRTYEKYYIYIEKINKKRFFLFKKKPIQVDYDSYNKLNIGDTLKDLY